MKKAAPKPAQLRIDFLDVSQKEDAIALIDRALEVVPTSRRFVDSAFSNDARKPVFFSATLSGKFAGVVSCLPLNGSAAMLCSLAVDESCRERGIGQALVRHAEGYVAQTMLEGRPGYITLGDRTRRIDPSSRFYDKLDYELTGDVSPQGSPVMIKRLNLR